MSVDWVVLYNQTNATYIKHKTYIPKIINLVTQHTYNNTWNAPKHNQRHIQQQLNDTNKQQLITICNLNKQYKQ